MTETLDLVALDDAGFERLYAERIKPCYDAHEPERVKAVATFKQRLMYALPGALAIGLILWAFFNALEFAIFALIAGGFVAYAWAYSDLNTVKNSVKEASLSAVAESIGVSYQMRNASAPAYDVLRSYDLLPSNDRRNFEDFFSGHYRGASFDLYEAHLERKSTDSKGRTTWTTVFRGQCLRLGFPRKFLGQTLVRRDAGIFNVFGGGNGLKKVSLEDPVFEKAFEVFSNDQVESRYLLHPAFMQRLVDLETALKGKRLRCGFIGGDLIIAVEGGDLFEPGDMFKPLADPVRARKIVDDFVSVLRVMDAVLTAQAQRPSLT